MQTSCDVDLMMRTSPIISDHTSAAGSPSLTCTFSSAIFFVSVRRVSRETVKDEFPWQPTSSNMKCQEISKCVCVCETEMWVEAISKEEKLDKNGKKVHGCCHGHFLTWVTFGWFTQVYVELFNHNFDHWPEKTCIAPLCLKKTPCAEAASVI